jgi:phospholipid transport system substrate-binding protein
MMLRRPRLPAMGFAIVLMTMFFSMPAGRAASDPGAFVEDLTYTAFETLRNTEIDEKERFSRFRDLVQNRLDMPRIGRFVLGANWRRADPDQQAEYQKLFSDYVVSAFAGRLRDYTNSKITIKGNMATGKGEYIVSTMVLNPKNPEPIKVDWRLRENAGALQVLDMSIEGVSMALTQRSEFSAVIQQNGGDINVLLTRLRDAATALNEGKQVTISN